MIKLRPEFEAPPPRRRRLLRRVFLLLVVAAMALAAERWRGQWALKNWKQEMTAKGETFDVNALWPPASAKSLDFSNQFAQTIGKWRPGWITSWSSPIVMEQAGSCRRGSQEPQPRLGYKGDCTNTWQDLDKLVQQNQFVLRSLSELMKDPPPAMSYDVAKSLEDDSFPYASSNIRNGAYLPYAAAMNDLHKGDLASAVQDLGTLLSFAKLYEKDPSLVPFIIRMALLGWSVDACWDALQANGWTEPQLAALQQECPDPRLILSELPRTLEAARVARIYQWHWLRSHSYQEWVARCRRMYEPFGWKPSPAETDDPWRQWLFHPLWSFAWADQEELEYLRHSQMDLMVLRAVVKQPSWLRLKDQMAANHQAYPDPAPIVAWRFYTKLPLADDVSEWMGAKLPDSPCSYPNFSRAWFISMKNLTLHEMVITAIALKRHELKHGKPAANLVALVPEFLNAEPLDFMDGKPLRYRLNPDNSFTLYSVGEDTHDDGGNCLAASSKNNAQDASPWNGKDWVWPQVAAEVKAPQVSNLTIQGRTE